MISLLLVYLNSPEILMEGLKMDGFLQRRGNGDAPLLVKFDDLRSDVRKIWKSVSLEF